MTKKPTIDPVFAEYTRTAPLGDLQFYLRCAERRLMTLELSEQTISIAREMVALEHVLLLGGGTPASNKARVWGMIDRFRSSIPGWAGNAGAKGSWVEPLESDAAYWQARHELTMTDITEPAPEPLPTDDTKRRKKTPEPTPEPVVRSVETEGPVTAEQIVAWHAPALERSARLNGYGVPQRVEPLTLDAVRALLTEGLPERPAAALATKPQRARQQPAPVVATLPCPSCSTPLATLACSACKTTWTLQPARPPKAVAAPRTPKRVQSVATTVDGVRTCPKCQQPRLADHFCQTHPTCLECRQQYRRELAARKRAA